MSKRSICAAAALLLLTLPTFARPKQDVIFFKNGDRMTCEIKKLEEGILVVSAPYAEAAISLDWAEIDHVESDQVFAFEDRRGEVVEGTFTARPAQVDRIAQVDGEVLARFHGAADAGLTYAKANEQSQFSFNGSLGYARPRWEAYSEAHVTLIGTGPGTLNSRTHYQVVAQRLFKDHWLTQGVADFLTSDEQSLTLRATTGGGVGRLLRRDSFRLAGLVGSVYNRELYEDALVGPTRFNSVEALVSFSFRYFQFKGTDIRADTRIYPGLTEPGRLRLDTTGSFHYELYKDLYWNISLYSNYDSRPPARRRSSDYGASMGVGYKF